MPTPKKLTAAIIDQARVLQAGGASLREVAEKLRVGKSQLAAALRVPFDPSPPPSPAPAATSSSAVELPQGGAATTKPDELLVLVRRILAARNGRARAELDEGLVVATRGETELATWLARPVEGAQIDDDELVEIRAGLALAVQTARSAEPGGPLLRALGIVDRMGKTVATVKARRPAEDTEDQATARIVAVRDKAVERIGVITSEEAADFAAARADFSAWLDTLGAIGGEARRRLAVVLDGPPLTAALGSAP